MRRYILLTTLMGLGLAATAGEASAQRRGWGWGNRYGGFAVTPNYIGPYVNNGNYNSGYYNNGYYYSPYNSGYTYPNTYYNTPGYTYYNTPNYYTPGTTYYTNPGVTYTAPGVITTTSGYTPQYNNNSNPIAQASYTSAESNNAAFVRVIVPTAETQVWLGSTKTETKGMDRHFQSPALEPGKDYTYTVKARWMADGKEVEQSRDVKVRANMTSFVDFRLPATTPVPMPDK